MASRHHLEHVQPALQRPVVERDAARRLEPDQLRQAQVGGKDTGAPAGEASASARRPASDRTPRAPAARRGARRKADWSPARRSAAGAGKLQHVGLLEANRVLQTRGCEIRARQLQRVSIQVAAEDRQRLHRCCSACAASARMRSHSARIEVAPASRIRSCAVRPAACRRAISAASISKVPPPHIGSSSGVPGCQPAQLQNAGGEILAQRRLARGLAQSALEQRLAARYPDTA